MTRRCRERSRWELQLTHHKLYLENNPPEVQLTAAWAKVSVVDGLATGPNVAFHFIFGAGFLF